MNDHDKNPLSELDPREKLDASKLNQEVRSALIRGKDCDFYTRMQLNMDTRYCRWPDQSDDGRKWRKDRRLRPDENPEVFPWPGASDARVRKVDEIIKERVGFMKAAYDLTDMRLSPRDMMPNDDLVQKSALWTMVANFYLESGKREMRRENARWVDIAETFGHSVLHVGWRETKQLDKKEIQQETLMVLVSEAAVQITLMQRQQPYLDAQQEPPEGLITPEEEKLIRESAMKRLEEMINDPQQQPMLAQQLRTFDPLMTKGESVRVVKGLRKEGSAIYYVPVTRDSGPDARALTPFVDILYPPETTRIKEVPWAAMPEWVSDVTLRERVETEGYDAGTVKEVIEKGPGVCYDLTAELGSDLEWVASGGTVGKKLARKEARANLWQIMHVYYRSSSVSGIPVLYHTILFGGVQEKALKHECCEDAHGQYPFVERMTQPEKETLCASEGVGEVSFTDQQEIKVQRDMRVDNSSLQMQPPSLVPLNHSGGKMNYRPRAQIPVRMTGGQGKPEFLTIRTDPTTSQEVEKTTKQSLDELWFRGPTTDSVVMQTMRRVMVNDFLSDLEAVRRMMWELVQENAGETVKAGVVDGLPINMEVSREEIQGGVSMQMLFDVGDLDPKHMETKAKLFREVVKPLDPSNNIPSEELSRVLLAGIAPGYARILIRPPKRVAEEETSDELRALGDILNGLEPPYVPGKDHTLRRDVILQAISAPGLNGGPSRVQKILADNPDVKALLENRLKFHDFQVKQTVDNPVIGRLGVEPLKNAA